MPNETYATRVAASVRAEMARRDVTQARLAEALGMTQPAISRRVSGQLPFDVDELHRIARFLDIPVSALIPKEDAA